MKDLTEDELETVQDSLVYAENDALTLEVVPRNAVLMQLGRAGLALLFGKPPQACLLFITNTHIRRKYYIGNYLAIGVFAAANVYVAVEAHSYIELFKARFLQVDFEALRAHAELWKTAYTESTFWFDAHYAVFALSLLVSLGLVACAVWKIRLMKEEAQLIAKGKEAAV